MAKIAFYDHRSASDTMADCSTGIPAATLKGMGVDVTHYFRCLCSHGLDMQHAPEVVVVAPSYEDPTCWSAIKGEVEQNPGVRFYIAVLALDEEGSSDIISRLRSGIGEYPNLSYLDYQQFLKTGAEIAKAYAP